MRRQPESLKTTEVIKRIITFNQNLNIFWKDAKGWAPIEAAQLLTKSRLDWQVDLSKCLNLWMEDQKGEGKLILGWTNLGALVEGTMSLFLSVFYKDYTADIHAVIKRGRLIAPDSLFFDQMRVVLSKVVGKDWNEWLQYIQSRRNSIHAFRSRDIGTFEELEASLYQYLLFLRYINDRLPYPDEAFTPREY